MFGANNKYLGRIQQTVANSVRFLYQKLFNVNAAQKLSEQKTFIAQILLLAATALSVAATVIIAYHKFFLHGPNDKTGLPLVIPFGAMLLFGFFYCLTRTSYYKIASYGLIVIFYLTATYMALLWGVDLAPAILVFAVVIVISGILIDTRHTLYSTIAVTATLFFLGYMQLYGPWTPNTYWKAETYAIDDIIMYASLLAIIATTAWLWNREIDKALKRAHQSEKALKEERDLLEVRVEKRTRQLKEIQLEKISNLYRFVEFGRLATGLFHDLMNPITAVSLNIETLDKNASDDIKKDLDRVVIASKRMNSFMQAIKKQIQNQEIQTHFSIQKEIEQVIQILSYKARKNLVEITSNIVEDVTLFGNPLKFNQLMTNIISNAVDAYEGLEEDILRKHEIHIDIRSNENLVQIAIQDWGCGIDANPIDKIFDPFYTTKAIEKGTGIGLSNTKQIIETAFGGEINVVSQPGTGTLFTIKLPKKNTTT